MPFWIGVAVSPFKYTEADCAYQYLKLEKKIAAGADYAVTQLGYDVKKFRELKRYLDERGSRTPLLGNVYVLGAKAAERMNKGEPPGCWVAPELLEKIQSESAAADKGQALRLERAARMAAILRGLGYAGAYIGGDHQADHVRWIMKRAEALATAMGRIRRGVTYAPKNGFLFLRHTTVASPKSGTLVPRLLDAMGRLFPVNREGPNSGACLRHSFASIDDASRSRTRSNASNSRSSLRCSDARPAAIASSARWNTCVRRRARRICATGPAAVRRAADAKW